MPLDQYMQLEDISVPVMERWELLQKYVPSSSWSPGKRYEVQMYKDLYGVDKVDETTIEILTEAYEESKQPGAFKRILKDKSKIALALVDEMGYDRYSCVVDCDTSLFRGVYRMDPFIYPKSKEDFERIERESGLRICGFDDWLDACEIMLDKACLSGMLHLSKV